MFAKSRVFGDNNYTGTNTKMKISNIPKTKICLSLLLMVFGFWFFTPTVSAKTVNCDSVPSPDILNKRICEASIKRCTNDAGSEAQDCRKIFREGAKKGGKSSDDLCNTSKNDNRERKACKATYKAGEDAGIEIRKDPNAKASEKEELVVSNGKSNGSNTCGGANTDQVDTKIGFGCMGNDGPDNMGPIEDMFYAFVRFLSNGVGVVMVIALIGAGIQYTTSEGSAEKTIKAKKKIQSVLIAIFIYFFTYAILQFLIPGGLFR